MQYYTTRLEGFILMPSNELIWAFTHFILVSSKHLLHLLNFSATFCATVKGLISTTLTNNLVYHSRVCSSCSVEEDRILLYESI